MTGILDQLKNGSKRLGKGAATQLGLGLDEWLQLLTGLKGPLCSNGDIFDNIWPRFFRLLSISVGIAAAVAGLSIVFFGKTIGIPTIPPALTLKIIGFFALGATVYSIYARMFGIRITPRQSFFCFGFVLIPWFPIIAAIP